VGFISAGDQREFLMRPSVGSDERSVVSTCPKGKNGMRKTK